MTEKGAAPRGSFLRAVITPHTKGSWGPFRRKAQAHCPTQRGGLLASLPPSHSTFPLPALIGIQFHARLQAPGSGFHQELRAGVLGEAQVEPSTFSLPEAWRGGPVGAPLKAPPLGSVSRDWVKGDRQRCTTPIWSTTSHCSSVGLTSLCTHLLQPQRGDRLCSKETILSPPTHQTGPTCVPFPTQLGRGAWTQPCPRGACLRPGEETDKEPRRTVRLTEAEP